MTTQGNATKLIFHELDCREVVGRFDGGEITSDAGGVLLREVEKRTRILGRMSECFDDHRDPERIEHSFVARVAAAVDWRRRRRPRTGTVKDEVARIQVIERSALEQQRPTAERPQVHQDVADGFDRRRCQLDRCRAYLFIGWRAALEPCQDDAITGAEDSSAPIVNDGNRVVAVPWRDHVGIVTAAAPHEIIARAAFERVVAVIGRGVIGPERIVAGAATKQVIAGAARDRIPVRAAVERVVVATAPEIIPALSAVENIVAVSAGNRVAAFVAVDGVVAGMTPEKIIVPTADDGIVAVIPVNRVAVFVAVDGVVAGMAPKEIGTPTADDGIVAAMPVNRVAARPADYGVVPPARTD